MLDIQNVTKSQILRVYSGRIGCMCGCKGNYRCTSEHHFEAEDECGYEQVVNDAQCKKVLKKLQAADPKRIETLELAADGSAGFYLEEDNGRCYAIYLCKSAQK
jgi:hypothetical protein